ncbi:ATP synthase [Rhodomicrobium udaipurense JA643]|uniref:FliI/YscN family ATPase n=1 Tax=Rhodomicrobium udaipurense TaxID=1202716 RepID=A0A8I1GJ32_9HYPH|nr:FliI/YscN family ATPase [Rhodomicrobium udaipurense]KAI95299.1 ATP synthase [Rhodomicrobium udaipurense JA643]MBJ7544447.1 FliI/YscN family ATPase [Rhodomicrobium udaipurense]
MLHEAPRLDIVPRLHDAVASANTRPLKGRVKRIVGTMIHAMVPNARLGEVCTLRDIASGVTSYAEIVGFDDMVAMLSPLGPIQGLSTATEVSTTGRFLETPVGEALLGRVLDGFGEPLDTDAKGPLPALDAKPLEALAPPALSRRVIDRPLSVGIRSIDGLLTCAEGQRIGIYGEPGTGKSQLLGQILRFSDADVNVIALVGERGREVREFIEHQLPGEAMARSVMVVATSDRSSVERVKGAQTAMTIAERFRDEGRRVLLVVDSITRLARALREIGLAAGEPPTRRGFPPSVFTKLPGLFERAGMGAKGSITAFFTVLMEGDGTSDPVAEETRSLLDGHIILSPKFVRSGHFPAIDVPASLSRVMLDVVKRDHAEAARKIRQLIAKHAEVEFLIQVGEYKPGGDPLADEAIAKWPRILDFLRQPSLERADFVSTLAQLRSLAE